MKSNYDFLTFFVIGIHQGHNTGKKQDQIGITLAKQNVKKYLIQI